MPIPAQCTAATLGSSKFPGRLNGSPPSASTAAAPTAMWVSGPASEIAIVHSRDNLCGAWYAVKPAMNSSEISASAPAAPSRHGVRELVDEREDRDAPGEPQAERVELVDRREQHHHDDEPRADVDGEPEQTESGASPGRWHGLLIVRGADAAD